MLVVEQNIRPEFDKIINDIADYVLNGKIESNLAFDTARLCLMDTLGCGILALQFSECTKLLGPVVPGAFLPDGARVPGTNYELDPVQAAFNIGIMNRWLDYNDTWLAAEWGHPSDNIAAILSICDYISRRNVNEGRDGFKVENVLEAIIKAHEIQGVLALQNSFNRVGLDHVILVKCASAALVAKLLGGDKDMIMRTISQVFVDGQSLRVYRHAPNTGSRKSWAAGDAAARGVRLALISATGEMGYPSALSVPTWGFYDVSFKGKSFDMPQGFGSYVMENVLFKISYPTEYHAQTAVECAIKLHPLVKDKIDNIETINIITHESAIRIISKEGPLHNPADRDHCLQYMVAVALIKGDITVEDYEDESAKEPLIDILREKMQISENKQFSEDYLNSEKRSIANSIEIVFTDGSKTDWVTVEYPIGHKCRREEGVPVLLNKFKNNLQTRFNSDRCEKIFSHMNNADSLLKMNVTDFMDMWCELS